MKKQLLSLLLLFTVSYTACAQDLIVTQKGDSINGKITKVKEDRIYFTFRYDDEVRHTLLPLDEVNYYQENFYEVAEVPMEDRKRYTDNFRKFDLSVSGGWSYRIARIHSDVSSEVRRHMKGMRSGYHLGADATYYFTEMVGAGLKYSMARFQNSSYNAIEDDITLHYIGPAFYGRFISPNRKTHFTYDLSMGYLHYRDEAYYGQEITYTGGTFGFSMGIGVDFKISRTFSLGFETSLNSGTLNKLKIDNGQQAETIKLEDDERENLSRIDLSLRLKWSI